MDEAELENTQFLHGKAIFHLGKTKIMIIKNRQGQFGIKWNKLYNLIDYVFHILLEMIKHHSLLSNVCL